MNTKLDISKNQINVPRIYVACLSAYNNGFLHGCWIDLTIGHSQIWKEIENMLEKSPVEDAEEWEIHDETYIPSRVERNIEYLCAYVDKLEEYGDKANLFACLCEDYDLDEAIEAIDERYIGMYDSEIDFIMSYVDDLGLLDNMPKNLQYYFDYDAFLRDMKLNSEIDIYESNGSYHVFHTN